MPQPTENLVSAPSATDHRRYRGPYPGDLLVTLLRDQRTAIAALDAVGGDLVEARLGRLATVFLVRHPTLVRQVLVDHNEAVTKARGLRLAEQILGRGLLTEEIPRHGRQRRLVLPAFHHARLRRYARQMTEATAAETATWSAAPFDVAASMTRLTLRIAGLTLFDADVLASADRVSRAVDHALRAFDAAQFPFAERLLWLPLPAVRRSRRARAILDDLVYGLIAERRADPAGREDLLTLLLDARDEDTGIGMTDEEVRDEVVTLLLAGHETTATALAWTWSLLSDDPDVEARLHAEVDALEAAPTIEDLGRLPYTRQVVSESMRLRPPAWVIGRQAAEPFALGGVPIEAGATVLFAPYHLHRDPRFWKAPKTVDPARFEPDARAGRHKFAYLPFSAGRRGCIGEQFAWTELVLVLATVARDWRLRRLGPPPRAHGSVTLRPVGPVRVRAERRP